MRTTVPGGGRRARTVLASFEGIRRAAAGYSGAKGGPSGLHQDEERSDMAAKLESTLPTLGIMTLALAAVIAGSVGSCGASYYRIQSPIAISPPDLRRVTSFPGGAHARGSPARRSSVVRRRS